MKDCNERGGEVPHIVFSAVDEGHFLPCSNDALPTGQEAECIPETYSLCWQREKSSHYRAPILLPPVSKDLHLIYSINFNNTSIIIYYF
jgi:hypothetical protein